MYLDRQKASHLPSAALNRPPEHDDGERASEDKFEKRLVRGKREERFWTIREALSIARETLGVLVIAAVALSFVVAVIEGHVHLPPELLRGSSWLWPR